MLMLEHNCERENQLLAQLHTEQEELKRVNDSNISIESELLELRKHYGRQTDSDLAAYRI